MWGFFIIVLFINFLYFSGHSETAPETKVVTRCCLHTWMRGLQVTALFVAQSGRVYLGLPANQH